MYRLYCLHVAEEITNLQDMRGHSLTWAVGEGAYVLSGLVTTDTYGDWQSVASKASLERAMMEIPLYVVEIAGERKALSAVELQEYDGLWSVESVFAQHIEYMLREMPGSVSLGRLLEALGQEPFFGSGEVMLASGFWQPVWRYLLDKNWQITEFRANGSQRRCDARWSRKSSDALWSRGDSEAVRTSVFRRVMREYDITGLGIHRNILARVPLGPIDATGFTAGENAVSLGGRLYLLPGHPWEELIAEENHSVSTVAPTGAMTADIVLLTLVGYLWAAQRDRYHMYSDRASDQIESIVRPLRNTEIAKVLDLDKFADISLRERLVVFDTSRWERF